MATTTLAETSRASINQRLFIGIATLLGILVVSGLLLALNYWVGVIFFFVSLLSLTRFGLKRYQARNLLLLFVICLFVVVVIGSLAQSFLTNNPGVGQLAERNALWNFLLGTYLGIFLTSTLIGIVVAILGVIVPFLILVAIATVGILKWHKKDERISALAAFWHLLADVLGIFNLSVTIDNGEIKGSEKDIERLEHFGGPGWLTVYPGQVVVLHEWGKITRVVGQGCTMLKREEQIKRIVPLNPQGGINDIDNVLTRDRIPLTIKVLHAAQVEPAKETRERLGESANDYLVGDDYDQCYASIARLAAIKAPDIWGALKGGVANNLKDAIMACDFDQLFDLGEDGPDLEASINRRKIAEIEKTVLEKARGSGLGKGLVLRVVDINQVRFPEKVEERIIAEATALAEERIRQIKTRTKEVIAQAEARITTIEADAQRVALTTQAEAERDVAEAKAQTIRDLAQAKAQAEYLEQRSRTRAREEHFQRIIQLMRAEDQTDAIGAILENLAASSSAEDELKRLLQLTVHYIRGEHTGNALSEDSKRKSRGF